MPQFRPVHSFAGIRHHVSMAWPLGPESDIITFMSDASASHTHVLPSATADEAEVAAWNALPRDEQVRRYRDLLA
jgi:hypothetical protein